MLRPVWLYVLTVDCCWVQEWNKLTRLSASPYSGSCIGSNVAYCLPQIREPLLPLFVNLGSNYVFPSHYDEIDMWIDEFCVVCQKLVQTMGYFLQKINTLLIFSVFLFFRPVSCQRHLYRGDIPWDVTVRYKWFVDQICILPNREEIWNVNICRSRVLWHESLNFLL